MYIQRTGINRDLGLYDDPDAFYAEHAQAFGLVRGILYRRAIRHRTHARVAVIRRERVPSIPGGRGPSGGGALMGAGHDHAHDHAGHSHGPTLSEGVTPEARRSKERAILIAAVLTGGFMGAEVLGGLMLWVAVGGLVVNALAFRVLSRAEGDNLDVRAAALHVPGDLLGWVAAIAASLVIIRTG